MLTRAVIVAVCVFSSAAAIGRASVNEPTLARSPFSDLPKRLGSWVGIEASRFDERTVQLLGADEYLHRVYQNHERRPVWLYVGFYASQRQGDTMHSPLNCLPGSGWQPVEKSRRALAVSDHDGAAQRTITVNEFVIERGRERQIVLYWYQSHGRVEPNEYKSKIWTVIDALRLNRTDGAIVRITSPVAGDLHEARERAAAFARDLFPSLHRHLPE